MGLFSKPEVVIAKESSNAKEYLRQLEELAEKAAGENAKKIAKEIAVVKAGIIGEDNILFELKNSGMDMVVLHDLYIESVSGASAQIDFLVLTPKINFVLECKICSAISRSTARAILSAQFAAAVGTIKREFIRRLRRISGICRCSRNEGAKMTVKSLPHGRITCLRTFLGA